MQRTRNGAAGRAARRTPGAAVRGSATIILIVLLLTGCATTAPGGEPETSTTAAPAASEAAAMEREAPAELEVMVDTIPGTTVTFEMIRLPGGTVTLPDGETVEVGPFWIEKTETTWDEFDVYALGLDL